ncbi:MAG: dihydrofolate reductase family protein, partial [Pseudonocardiaceae bacterium]
IAVVTRSAVLDPAGPLFTDTEVAPLVLTCAAAPAARRAALERAGAHVELVGERSVELPTALAALARRGLLRVLCEGGPRLFGHLVAVDAVDELCLTLTPVLAGGDEAERIASGNAPEVPRELRLDGALLADGDLLLRYRRIR